MNISHMLPTILSVLALLAALSSVYYAVKTARIRREIEKIMAEKRRANLPTHTERSLQ